LLTSISAVLMTAALAAQQSQREPAGSPASPHEQQLVTAEATTSPWSDDRPITHFFQNLGRDLAHLPSRESGALLTRRRDVSEDRQRGW
jgi:hypothetical protein